MDKKLNEYILGPSKGKPKTGNYKSRVTKGTKSGNADLDSYAGKVSQSGPGGLQNPNQNTATPAKKPNPPAQPNPGRHPFGANFVPKPPTTNGKRSGYTSPTAGKKPANRQTY